MKNEHGNVVKDLMMARGTTDHIFCNPMLRILSKQYPVNVENTVVHLSKHFSFRNFFEKTFNPTVVLVKGERGNVLGRFFIPEAYNKNPYRRVVYFKRRKSPHSKSLIYGSGITQVATHIESEGNKFTIFE